MNRRETLTGTAAALGALTAAGAAPKCMQVVLLAHGAALLLEAWLGELRAWAHWLADAVQKKNVDALLDYRQKAPGVRESLPTHEHFVPLVAAVGAAPDEKVAFPITGWWNGASVTRRSVQRG